VDRITQQVVDFTAGVDAGMLSDALVHEAKRRAVDALGCMIGALGAEPVAIARGIAAGTTGDYAATALAVPAPTTVEMAVFANTVAVRYLDFNDTYFGPKGGGGHPSDLFPTAFAVAEAGGLGGTELVLLATVGYQVLCTLAATSRIRERGWDQGLYTSAAAAMMTGRALGLDRERLAHALSLAVTPHVPTRQTRAGELSMWKGAATAEAARAGVFAARLAAGGMTGPPLPFEGEHGIFDQVSGPFELDLPVPPEQYVIENAHTKSRPAEYNSQGALDLAVELHREYRPEDIAALHVETYHLGYHEIGREPAKWDPRTRETADHSLPWLIARALVDGDVGLGSFTGELIRDPELRPLMNRITVAENPEFTRRFSADLTVRMTVELTSGERVVRESTHPRGHVRNPMTDAEFDRKFDDLIAARSAADIDVCRAVRDRLWRLDTAGDVSGVFAPLGGLGR
jgi:2-methylcitrate dehydratase